MHIRRITAALTIQRLWRGAVRVKKAHRELAAAATSPRSSLLKGSSSSELSSAINLPAIRTRESGGVSTDSAASGHSARLLGDLKRPADYRANGLSDSCSSASGVSYGPLGQLIRPASGGRREQSASKQRSALGELRVSGGSTASSHHSSSGASPVGYGPLGDLRAQGKGPHSNAGAGESKAAYSPLGSLPAIHKPRPPPTPPAKPSSAFGSLRAVLSRKSAPPPEEGRMSGPSYGALGDVRARAPGPSVSGGSKGPPPIKAGILGALRQALSRPSQVPSRDQEEEEKAANKYALGALRIRSAADTRLARQSAGAGAASAGQGLRPTSSVRTVEAARKRAAEVEQQEKSRLQKQHAADQARGPKKSWRDLLTIMRFAK